MSVSTTDTVDTIVIGAGHNGLTTAATLAQAGQSVLVLERNETVGGLAASHEFFAGYRSAGVLEDSTLVRPQVIEALGLRGYGLVVRDVAPDMLALCPGRAPLRIAGRLEIAAEAIGAVHAGDGAQYLRYAAFLRRLAPALRELFDRPAVDIVGIEAHSLWDLLRRGLAVRRLGRADMTELLRLPVMCVADVLGEWFEDDVVKAALCFDAVAGTWCGPWSPGTALNLLRHHALRGPGIEGGGPMLIAALRRAAEANGVKIRCGARVESIATDAQGVRGVVLADGERIEAKRIAASCDPKTTMLRLLPPGSTSVRVEHHLRTFRSRGAVGHVLLAIEGDVEFGGEVSEYFRVGAGVDTLERAYDATKYGEFPSAVALAGHVPTQADPSLAPSGCSVVALTVHSVPTQPVGGWNASARATLGELAVAALATVAPDVVGRIVGQQVQTPADLEERYGVWGGHCFHGEHTVDQLLVRPAPACIHHRTPVAGLWLCGSGSHPGGGLTCAPGALAAAAILRA